MDRLMKLVWIFTANARIAPITKRTTPVPMVMVTPILSRNRQEYQRSLGTDCTFPVLGVRRPDRLLAPPGRRGGPRSDLHGA
ncbi:hypothetical protein GCM10025783_05010 [Amnibacterium soli]|uniref:Secreted protein n=1 Tax=Amnibacterium soli TaxID=1282736 RepID=A0ABP8YUV5_9MICO